MGRACLCLSLHLVSPWHIFTFYNLASQGNLLPSFSAAVGAMLGSARQIPYIKKVFQPGAHFLLYAPDANSSF